MFIQPYLFFDGRCDEAIEFYKKAIGAEVAMLMRWKDARQVDVHARQREQGDAFLPQDRRHQRHGVRRPQYRKPKFDGFALSLDVKTDAEAQTLFKALSDGGEVAMPLGPTFFATSFGMVKDRFGVHWMVLKAK